MKIEPLTQQHWPRVLEIYLEGIAGGHATFETAAPTWEAWTMAHLEFPRFVMKDATEVDGWAALSPVSARHAYRGVAEVSVYVAQGSQGRGFGRELLKALISASEEHGIWTLQASIFPENLASLRLHASCGFREVGQRERVARLNGIWRNTVLLERRSTTVGKD
jgi:L-amino acid N-acyltransferase YncA